MPEMINLVIAEFVENFLMNMMKVIILGIIATLMSNGKSEKLFQLAPFSPASIKNNGNNNNNHHNNDKISQLDSPLVSFTLRFLITKPNIR